MGQRETKTACTLSNAGQHASYLYSILYYNKPGINNRHYVRESPIIIRCGK